MGGDFNIDILNSNKHTKNFLEVLESNGLRYLIETPTHFNKFSNTVIDNILTNTSDIEEVHVIQSSLSDHYGTTIKLPAQTKECKAKLYLREINPFTITKLNALLLKQDWGDVLKNSFDPETTFQCVFKELLNTACPFKLVKNNKKKNGLHWITKGILISRKQKEFLHRKFLKTKSNDTEITYRTYNRIYNKVIRNATTLQLHKDITQANSNGKKSGK